MGLWEIRLYTEYFFAIALRFFADERADVSVFLSIEPSVTHRTHSVIRINEEASSSPMISVVKNNGSVAKKPDISPQSKRFSVSQAEMIPAIIPPSISAAVLTAGISDEGSGVLDRISELKAVSDSQSIAAEITALSIGFKKDGFIF